MIINDVFDTSNKKKNLLKVLGAEKKRDNYSAVLTDLSERWVFPVSLIQKYNKWKKEAENE